MPDNQWIILNGRTTTVVLEHIAGEAPLWRYWGARLADGATPATPLRSTRPEPTFSAAFDQPLSVFPGAGIGWFGAPALLAHRAGRDWSFQANTVEVECDGHCATIKLIDTVAALQVEIRITLDPQSDVLTLSSRLENRGTETLDVQWLASGVLPLPCGAQAVHSFSGRHNGEFIAVTDPLTRSIWRRENRRGLSSHDCFPGATVSADGTFYGAQLAWSGNHVQMIEWLDDGRHQWQMGEGFAPGEVRLAPGEAIETAEMLATCAPDANGVAQNFHGAIRSLMDWPGGAMRPRPVHINTWEGFYFDHDESALKDLANHAAAIGIERFVLDDGWFHGRDNDRSSLGDWWADARKYPQGLAPLAHHVTELGMEFGLWVEPEMVNPDSDLYRTHPEWALAISGRPQITARNQLVLDMRRQDVRDYLFDCIARLLSDLPIGYLKWDHNRELIAAGNRAAFRAQIHGTYALLARLREAFPSVEIEACAAGGGRIDAGIIRHTHRFWTSDNIDAVSRLSIQRGYLQFLPPELMGAHVGASPAHATGRKQSMDFRAGVALPGHFGVELDVRKLDDGDREKLAQWVATYKTHRDRLHLGKVWLGDAGDGLYWQAHGDGDGLLVFVYRTEPQSWKHAPQLQLPMLDVGRRYRVGGTDYHGGWLSAVGLPLAPMKAERFQLVEIEALT
ncbi:MAG: alpha-galactosidase [Sphingobium sp.]|nr:MAG: alpha-galactosidase [Sphingobium sp.]